MIDDLDLDELRRVPQVSYYFRYPLHRDDFRELQNQSELRGHYAAKALYAGYMSDGRVDRSSGYSGDIAALFVPVEARTVGDASLVVTHIEPEHIVLADGRRNWSAIYGAAAEEIRGRSGSHPERFPNPPSIQSPCFGSRTDTAQLISGRPSPGAGALALVGSPTFQPHPQPALQ